MKSTINIKISRNKGIILKISKLKILLFYSWKLFSIIDYKLLIKTIPNIPRRFILFWAYTTKSTQTKVFPPNIVIEMTNVCNLNCIMCPSQKQERAKGHLSKETFIKLVDQLQGKVEIIEFALYGEILIHPDYDWFIKYAKAKKMKTSVSTNASFLTAEHSKRLIESGLDHLIISIDDVSGGQYDDIRKGSHFAKIATNTQQFLTLNQGKIFTVIQKIHMSVNKTSTWNYIDEMLPLGADIVRLKPLRDLDRDKKNLRVSDIDDIENIQCPYLWKAPVVTWKGQMIPCGNDYNATMPFGDVYNDDITKVWDGELFQEMRKKHINKNKESIALCQGCSAIEFNSASFALSSLFDGLNSRKVLSVLQTLKILYRDF